MADNRHAVWYRRIVKVVEVDTGRIVGYAKINVFFPDAFNWDLLWSKGFRVFTL